MKTPSLFATIFVIACNSSGADPAELAIYHSLQDKEDYLVSLDVEDFSSQTFDECSEEYQSLLQVCQSDLNNDFFYSEIENSYLTEDQVIDASSFACCCTSCCSDSHY